MSWSRDVKCPPGRMAVVCRAVAGLRSRPSNDSELVTQEIFGRNLEVHSVRDSWVECTLSDGYRGWLPVNSVHLDAHYKPTHIVVKRFARIRVRGRTGFVIPMGSLIEAGRLSGSEYVIGLPGGGQARVGRSEIKKTATLPWPVSRFRALAREVEGAPYLWGGKSTFGFDCSGLVQFIFAFFGIDLPRDSRDQALAGRPVKSPAGLRKYDLIFFATKSEIDHVAVHLGDLAIFHASGHVCTESLRQDSPLFRPDLGVVLRAIRRIIDV